MKFNKILILAILFLGLSHTLYATETGYEVELIIFEYNGYRQLDTEDWSYNDKLNHDKDIAETQNEYKDNEFIELDWQQAKLSESLERIENSDKYNVLFKKRWKQTGLDRDTAYAIDISSLSEAENNTENEIAVDIETPNIATISLNLENSLQSDLSITPPTYIQGRVKLIMSRYLHFEVNLNYFQFQEDDVEAGYRSYPIISERRMRSRETHYIDHPMVGIIVHAIPFKIEPKVIPEKTDNALPVKIN